MVFLISEDFVKSTTNISDNVQGKFLQPAIRETQQIDLQSVIGTAMLNKLCDLVSANTIGNQENAAYKELLDNCQYFMAYSVVAKLVVISAVKIDNMGPNTTSDDKVQNLSLDDTFRMQDYYIQKSDWYKNRLQEYILENRTSLPEISEAKCHDIKANLYSAADCGIWLGGVRGKGGYETQYGYDKPNWLI